MKETSAISATAFPFIAACMTAACLMVSGCTPSRLGPVVENAISFSSSAQPVSEAVRKAGAGSTLINTDALLQSQSFGIYGYKSVDDATNFENVFTSMSAQKVYYTTSELTQTNSAGITWTAAANTWTYDDRQKWERAKHYRFRAFWPYEKAAANVITGSTAKFLLINYQQVEDYDLMVAYATRYPMGDATTADPTGTRRVPMTFHHALSGLRFKLRYKEVESLVNVSDKITSLYVTGLFLAGTLVYGEANGTTDTAETIRWNINSNTFDSTTELFKWTGSETFAVGATTSDVTVATVFENDHVVFVIPQTVNEFDYRETYVYFTTESGGDAVQKAKIPETTFEPGKIYTYTLVISDSSVQVNIDIEDWTETQSNIDIYF